MRVLVIKLTSMGDVIHTLPALTDAQKAMPNISFDFVVEESFQEIPNWHSSVNKVIPVATRRWRKSLISSRQQITSAVRNLRGQHYDAIIDAQGLLKSAFIGSLAKGPRHGYGAKSIREPLATRLYQHTHDIDQSLHAITRIRQLFAQTLQYKEPRADSTILDYGLSLDAVPLSIDLPTLDDKPYVLFLHGTTWRSKEWPTDNWCALAEKISVSHQVLLPWGNDAEYRRAMKIAQGFEPLKGNNGTDKNVDVLPKLTLSSLAHLIANAAGIVAVDTGLGHLSAALNTPTISIYGPTDTHLIGTWGGNQYHLCATEKPNWRGIKKNEPFDYGKISVDIVYDQLQKIVL